MFERISLPRKPLVRARAVARRLGRHARAFWAVPANRERSKASAVFAAIFAFTAVGVDYVVTGGPDWNPGGVAYAMEISQTQTRGDLVVRAGPLAPTQTTEEDAWIEIGLIDYSFTTETLLGGPDTVLASYEPFADGITRNADKPDALAAALDTQSGKAQPL
ncbi:MAG: hypothetical protein M0D54_07495 [Hyphomonadaceae bacterium JAD_PAG50586_4]|nr:MAG: hypothetical protein M0D54_07495 [Hyphomonadaceae bacterium JAD_PAG50586_4]